MDSIKILADLFKAAKKKSGSDYTATVTRTEAGVAYVQLTGSDITDTPVSMTINASPGDKVRVRIANGKAWITGSDSAPPTNDAYAKQVKTTLTKEIESTNVVVQAVSKVVQAVKKIADNTNQYFWHTETGTDTGAHITEIPQDEFLADPEAGGGNLLARSNGIAIRDGLTELATFAADGQSLLSPGGLEIAHIGYGTVIGSDGAEVQGPFYTFGYRLQRSDIGYMSSVIGWGAASGLNSLSVCSGEAQGNRSFAHGFTVANGDNQFTIGRRNAEDNNNKYAFIIGNGTASAPSNAFTVDWNGAIDVADKDNSRLNLGIDSGTLTGAAVAASSYIDLPVTFHKTFTTIPTVVVGFLSDSTGYDMGSLSCSAHSRTLTGCTVRIYNNSTSERKPYIQWIAVGA